MLKYENKTKLSSTYREKEDTIPFRPITPKTQENTLKAHQTDKIDDQSGQQF